MVYQLIRAAKTGAHPQRTATTLYLVGDNFAENKCNEVAAFCCLLVLKKYLPLLLCRASLAVQLTRWFREVYLLYGPVGHTHNGIDAAHRIHNEVPLPLVQ
jgi:hypothetical protein